MYFMAKIQRNIPFLSTHQKMSCFFHQSVLFTIINQSSFETQKTPSKSGLQWRQFQKMTHRAFGNFCCNSSTVCPVLVGLPAPVDGHRFLALEGKTIVECQSKQNLSVFNSSLTLKQSFFKYTTVENK